MTRSEGGSAEWPRVFPNAAAVDREVFDCVAQTRPGIVRSLLLLLAELTELGDLSPELQRALGEHLRRMGETVIARADRADGGAGRAE